MKRRIAILVTLFLMIIIFLFSSQPGQESYMISDSFVIYLKRVPFIGQYAQVYIRKFAHIALYFILGIDMNIVLYITISNKKIFQSNILNYCVIPISSILLCFIYACTDEFHQTFVLDREGCFRDVMIDMVGVVIGTLVTMGILLVFAVIKRYIRNRKT